MWSANLEVHITHYKHSKVYGRQDWGKEAKGDENEQIK